MLKYLFHRLLWMIPTLFGVTLLVFALMAAAPGGLSPAQLVEGGQLDPEAKKALLDYYNLRYGLDQPWYWQYLRWLNNLSPVGFAVGDSGQWQFVGLKAPDLGESFRYGRSVGELMAERVPITVLLNVLSLPLVYLLAISIGVQAAQATGGGFDLWSSRVLLALWSMPNMLVGVLMIGFFTSIQHWKWFPTAGLGGDEHAPFLPHWTETSGALLSVMACVVGIACVLFLAYRASLGARRGVCLLLGAGVIYALIQASSELAQWPPVNQSVAVIVLGGLLGHCLAILPFAALRLVVYLAFSMPLVFSLLAYGMPGAFTPGWLLDRLWHLFLPVLCLSYGGVAFLAKLVRSSVLSQMKADYVRTALAKGLGREQILWRHVFRNSLLPLITVSAALLPALMAGSVVVESLFSIDGMGRLAVEAVKGRDKELVLGITLVSSLLTLIGYWLADLCYVLADPRVRYD